MKCPNCDTDFESERELAVERDPTPVPWYRLVPPGKVTCPVCATHLKHRRSTLWTACALGLMFIVAMCLKTVFPDSTILKNLFLIFTVMMIIGIPALMRRGGYFRRGNS